MSALAASRVLPRRVAHTVGADGDVGKSFVAAVFVDDAQRSRPRSRSVLSPITLADANGSKQPTSTVKTGLLEPMHRRKQSYSQRPTTCDSLRPCAEIRFASARAITNASIARMARAVCERCHITAVPQRWLPHRRLDSRRVRAAQVQLSAIPNLNVAGRDADQVGTDVKTETTNES
jgi:hypothetical protein